MSKLSCVALYFRISVEDESIRYGSEKESNSISNQRDLIYDYLKRRAEFSESKIIELCDDGFSGANFQRPAVRNLLEMAKKKEIECIIVKDFSRFGRNYLEVSDYIDQIFPFLGIRFISVNDEYDSADMAGMTSGIDVAFRNIIHDYYCKDISEKSKSAKKMKAERGEYLSPYAPFGYRKSAEDKNKLIVDDESSQVVKRIFHMACIGMKTHEIAKALNIEGVPIPSVYKKKKGYSHPSWSGDGKENGLWFPSMISRILRDERYLGKVVYGKRYRAEVGSRKTLGSEKDNWIVVEDMHEPLVSLKDFERVQKGMGKFPGLDGRIKQGEHVLSGKLKCGVCGYSLVRQSKPIPRYYCETRYKAKECGCMQGTVLESEFVDSILAVVQSYVSILLDDIYITKTIEFETMHIKLGDQLAEYMSSLTKIKEQKAMVYDGYADGNFSREKYLHRREQLSKRQDEIEGRIDTVQCELDKVQEKIANADMLPEHMMKQCLIADCLTREMVVELIDYVEVYSKQSFHIEWRFQSWL